MGGVLHIQCIPRSLEKRNGVGGRSWRKYSNVQNSVYRGRVPRGRCCGVYPRTHARPKKETPTVRSGSIWLASRDCFYNFAHLFKPFKPVLLSNIGSKICLNNLDGFFIACFLLALSNLNCAVNVRNLSLR